MYVFITHKHLFSHWGKVLLVEKSKFANIQSSVFVKICPVARSLLTIFYEAKQFAISTVCQCCVHTKQHTICAAPPLTCSKKVSSSSQQYLHAADIVSEDLHQHIFNHAPRLQTTWTVSSSTGCLRFHFLLSFSNCAYHKQAPSTKGNDCSHE